MDFSGGEFRVDVEVHWEITWSDNGIINYQVKNKSLPGK